MFGSMAVFGSWAVLCYQMVGFMISGIVMGVDVALFSRTSSMQLHVPVGDSSDV